MVFWYRYAQSTVFCIHIALPLPAFLFNYNAFSFSLYRLGIGPMYIMFLCCLEKSRIASEPYNVIYLVKLR